MGVIQIVAVLTTVVAFDVVGVQWYSVFDDALQGQQFVRVSDVVRAHVRRVPTRSEMHAARRAANSYAARGLASVVHVPHRGANVLVLVRDDVDVEHNSRAIEDVASGRAGPLSVRRGPRSERRVLTVITRHVVAAGSAARAVDVGKVDRDHAMVIAHELDLALDDLGRLRDRLCRRSTHGRMAIG